MCFHTFSTELLLLFLWPVPVVVSLFLLFYFNVTTKNQMAKKTQMNWTNSKTHTHIWWKNWMIWKTLQILRKSNNIFIVHRTQNVKKNKEMPTMCLNCMHMFPCKKKKFACVFVCVTTLNRRVLCSPIIIESMMWWTVAHSMYIQWAIMTLLGAIV